MQCGATAAAPVKCQHCGATAAAASQPGNARCWTGIPTRTRRAPIHGPATPAASCANAADERRPARLARKSARCVRGKRLPCMAVTVAQQWRPVGVTARMTTPPARPVHWRCFSKAGNPITNRWHRPRWSWAAPSGMSVAPGDHQARRPRVGVRSSSMISRTPDLRLPRWNPTGAIRSRTWRGHHPDDRTSATISAPY